MADARVTRLGRALLAGVLLAGALAAALPGPAAAAVSVPTPLLQDPPDIRTPLSSGPAVAFVVDRQRGHLFAATGYPASTVMVTDMAGELLETIEGQVGARGMAISADGDWIYVALREGDAVGVIDLATVSEHHRIHTGRESCPMSLATAGSRLWVSYGCHAVAMTPDERTVFVVAIDSSGRLASYGAIAFTTRDLARGPLYRTGPHTSAIAVSPDGSHLARTTHGGYSSATAP